MIKCPLCSWSNPESTKYCISCGGDLESRPGLVQEDGNPDCYSFTPPRRILDKGVGVTGSGNDLVFRFSSSKFTVMLIIAKIIMLAAFPYAGIKLYRAENSLFYILIPLTILFIIELFGWILLAHGGRRKRRREVSLGLRMLYAFHAIGMAYCILMMLITIYLSVAIGLSWNLGKSLGPVLATFSSGDTINLLIIATIVLLFFVVFLNICAKFFHHAHDIFARNSIKFYPFTIVIAIVFVLAALLGVICLVLIFYKDYVFDFVSRYDFFNSVVYSLLPDRWNFVSGCIAINTIISLVSAVMIVGYIRNYKKLFIKL